MRVLGIDPQTVIVAVRSADSLKIFSAVEGFIKSGVENIHGLLVLRIGKNPGIIPSSLPEIMIALGVWAMGFLVLTALFKIAVSVKEEIRD